MADDDHSIVTTICAHRGAIGWQSLAGCVSADQEPGISSHHLRAAACEGGKLFTRATKSKPVTPSRKVGEQLGDDASDLNTGLFRCGVRRRADHQVACSDDKGVAVVNGMFAVALAGWQINVKFGFTQGSVKDRSHVPIRVALLTHVLTGMDAHGEEHEEATYAMTVCSFCDFTQVTLTKFVC